MSGRQVVNIDERLPVSRKLYLRGQHLPHILLLGFEVQQFRILSGAGNHLLPLFLLIFFQRFHGFVQMGDLLFEEDFPDLPDMTVRLIGAFKRIHHFALLYCA